MLLFIRNIIVYLSYKLEASTMIKTDNRHYNNTSSNRSLHIELDLWLAYKENGEKPLLLGTATAGKHNFELYYAPNRIGHPFWIKGIDNDWNANYETIRKAKYYLGTQYNKVKWTKSKKQN